MDPLVTYLGDPYLVNSMYWSGIWLLLGGAVTEYVLRKKDR